MTPKHLNRGNRLLDALAPETFDRLAPWLEPVELQAGKVIREPGRVQQWAYFPLDCIISLVNAMQDGRSTEVAAIGNEGFVGVSLFLADGSAVNRAEVFNSGRALRLDSRQFNTEFALAAEFQSVVLRYTLALLTQVAQNAACIRHHPFEQRLCRWLLLCMDRCRRGELHATHEAIAAALGVRREAVTLALRELQAAGVLLTARSQLTLDRARLERHACECYALVRNEFDRLLPARESFS